MCLLNTFVGGCAVACAIGSWDCGHYKVEDEVFSVRKSSVAPLSTFPVPLKYENMCARDT